MGIKKSVMISDENADIVTKEYNGEWSYAVNKQFDLAIEMKGLIRRLASQLLPDLPLDVWQYVLNAFSGCYHDERWRSPVRIASAVMNDYGVEVLDDCLPEFQSVVRRLAALTQPEQFAVREFVAWYWSSDVKHGESWNDTVKNFRGQ